MSIHDNEGEATASPSSSSSSCKYSNLRNELKEGGLDVFAPMKVAWYNDYIQQLGLLADSSSTGYLEMSGETHKNGETTPFGMVPLPEFGRGGDHDDHVDGSNGNSSSVAFVIGNSKALWPCFLDWLRRKQQQQQHQKQEGNFFIPDDPVDMYTTELIQHAMENFATTTSSKKRTTKYDIFLASDMSPERLVDMNRAAYVSNLCYFSEDLFLSVHPVFGAWVAFRAVVVIDLTASELGVAGLSSISDTTSMGNANNNDVDATTTMTSTIMTRTRPPFLPPLLTKEEAIRAKACLNEAIEASSSSSSSSYGSSGTVMSREIAQKWANMRNCVNLGREYKYTTQQSDYHYTHDPSILLECLSVLPTSEQIK